MDRWTLSIDFGTTNTAAAVGVRQRPALVRAIKLAPSSMEMPSAVLVTPDEIVAGEVASNMARASSPGAHEPTPKRRIDEPEVWLGGRRVAPVDLVAAVLERAARSAARQFDGEPPSELVLTHPGEWATARQRVLAAAATAAGLPEPLLVPEPVAAAVAYAAQHGTTRRPIAVYDLGGGTFDIALLRADAAGGYEVMGVDTIDPLGGEMFDRVLLDLVVEGLVSQGQGEEVEGLGGDRTAIRRTLVDEVRNAKHQLSERTSAMVSVPFGDQGFVVTVTRPQFEDAIAADVDASVSTTLRTLESAGLAPSDLGRLCLTGGSTYVPLVARALREGLGVEPATFDDPKTITAHGGILAAWTLGQAPATVKLQPPEDDQDATKAAASTAGSTDVAGAGRGRLSKAVQRAGRGRVLTAAAVIGAIAVVGIVAASSPLTGGGDDDSGGLVGPGVLDGPEDDEGLEEDDGPEDDEGLEEDEDSEEDENLEEDVDPPVTWLEEVFDNLDLGEHSCSDVDPEEAIGLGPTPRRSMGCSFDDRWVAYHEFTQADELATLIAEADRAWDALEVTPWYLANGAEVGQLRIYDSAEIGAWALWTIDELQVAAIVRAGWDDSGELVWTYDQARAAWSVETFDATLLE